MIYVETSATLATVRVPSIVQEMQRAHKARLQRIKDAAISKPAPTEIADDPMVAVLESAIEAQPPTWEERQKAHWFEIVESGPIPRIVRPWPMVAEIQSAVCRYYGVSRSDMFSPKRHKSIALARQVAVYICRRTTIHSLPELGRRFGRDHTTQIHAVKKIRRLMDADAAFAAEVEGIIASLGCSA